MNSLQTAKYLSQREKIKSKHPFGSALEAVDLMTKYDLNSALSKKTVAAAKPHAPITGNGITFNHLAGEYEW